MCLKFKQVLLSVLFCGMFSFSAVLVKDTYAYQKTFVGYDKKPLTEAEKQALQIEKEQIERIIKDYVVYKDKLTKSINKKIKDGKIDSSCQNLAISEAFMLSTLDNFKSLFPVYSSGVFEVNQVKNIKSPYTLISPKFNDVIYNAKEDGIKFNPMNVKKNMFAVRVLDPTVFRTIISPVSNKAHSFIKHRQDFKTNILQQKNINELAFFTSTLTDKKEQEDFLKIAERIVEYNSMVCIY